MNTHNNIRLYANPESLSHVIASGKAIFNTLGAWHVRAKTRIALSRLDQHQLNDIGVSEREANTEFSKTFWQD